MEASINVAYKRIRFFPLSYLNQDLATELNQLTDILVDLAPLDKWEKITLNDLQSNTVQYQQHLILDNVLSKTDDPNYIFQKVYKESKKGQYFAFLVHTSENIKHSIIENTSNTFFLVYYPIHFILRRVLPKLKGFRKITRLLKMPVDMSQAEILGRVLYNGFEIIRHKELSKNTVFIVRKNQEAVPPFQSIKPSNEGFIFRMNRLGKNNKPFRVFKFRTMHPYAEYVQAYLHELNGLDDSGKFKDDFRVSTGGRILRKYWIDELPMLVNILKGDLKLIGVRPLSQHYFDLYPSELKQLRSHVKPGLLPPYYADLPNTFDEIVSSEIRYIKAYERQPLLTDIKYFFLILKNIVINKARSK